MLRRYAHPDSFDPVKGRSALHAAAKHRHVAVARLLLAAAANVELTTADGSGYRALHFAAERGCLPIVEALLHARADPSAATAHGKTASGVADGRVRDLLHRVASERHRRTGESFASAELVAAARANDARRVAALLHDGADPDSADADGTGALHHACDHRCLHVVELLLGAKASIDRPARGSGATPLICAARAGPTRLVALLLDGRADVMASHAREGYLAIEAVSHLRTQERDAIEHLLAPRIRRVAPIAGWLTKLGGHRRTWQRRYCVLTSTDPSHGQLRYFADEALTTLKGAIDLYDLLPEAFAAPAPSAAALHADASFAPEPALTFGVTVSRPAPRTYVFVAASQMDHVAWCDQLSLLLHRNHSRRLEEETAMGEEEEEESAAAAGAQRGWVRVRGARAGGGGTAAAGSASSGGATPRASLRAAAARPAQQAVLHRRRRHRRRHRRRRRRRRRALALGVVRWIHPTIGGVVHAAGWQLFTRSLFANPSAAAAAAASTALPFASSAVAAATTAVATAAAVPPRRSIGGGRRGAAEAQAAAGARGPLPAASPYGWRAATATTTTTWGGGGGGGGGGYAELSIQTMRRLGASLHVLQPRASPGIGRGHAPPPPPPPVGVVTDVSYRSGCARSPFARRSRWSIRRRPAWSSSHRDPGGRRRRRRRRRRQWQRGGGVIAHPDHRAIARGEPALEHDGGRFQAGGVGIPAPLPPKRR